MVLGVLVFVKTDLLSTLTKVGSSEGRQELD
jgi:hypothetical protein